MNIKSLLLGSAAALVAVSGARAADVIVADPEPVEYVRVCDAFGTGYFYIPGTETCLRISGYVRYDIGFGDLNGVISNTGDETWNKRARASINIDTGAETELGTLRTHVETRWQWDTNQVTNNNGTAALVTDDFPLGYTNDGEFSINFAWIELGGLRIGKDESYFTTFTGYGGSVINDTTGGGYGPFDTALISYTYTSGAFTAGIAFEEGDDSDVSVAGDLVDFDGDGLADVGGPLGWGIDDYMPHVVAGLGYDAGIVNLRAVFAYDTRDNYAFVATGGPIVVQQGGWAAKLRGDVDITSSISAFLMVMYGEDSSAYTTWRNSSIVGDETWSVIGGASIGLTPKATFNTQIQWAEGGGINQDVWHVAANVNYELTDGFIVRPEVQWLRNAAGVDAWGGTLRFQRSF